MTSPLHLARTIRRELGGRPFVDAPYQWGVVHAIGTNTVDLYLDGSSTITPSVRYLASYYPVVGDVVKVDRYRSDRVVVGSLANGTTPIAGLLTAPILDAYASQSQTISTATWTTLTLDTVRVDSADAYSSGTWTCPQSGWYQYSQVASWSPSASGGDFEIGLMIGGSEPDEYKVTQASQGGRITVQFSGLAKLTADDDVAFACYQTTGSDQDTVAGFVSGSLLFVHT